MLAIPGMQCLDLGQAGKMGLDFIYGKASVRRAPLVRLIVPRAELTAHCVRKRFSRGATLIYEAETVAQAKSVWRGYVADSQVCEK